MNLPLSASFATTFARDARRAFTLIELIMVMLLLALAAALVAPRMASFFRGRVLNSEARRLLSLTHLAQSRATAEGAPVILWLDTRTSTYGITVADGSGAEDQAFVFAADPSLTLVVPFAATTPPDESEELLALPESLSVIRFNPNGWIDESSVRVVEIHQGPDGALQLAQEENRLGYEIRPIANLD